MVRQDRFLLAILAGLAVLAGASIWVVLAGSPAATYVDETGPEGVVHNYVLALQRGDIDRAYGYLADCSGRPTLLEFRSSYVVTSASRSRATLEIGDPMIDGDDAMVDVTVSTDYGGISLLDTSHSYSAFARLVLQEGHWRLVEMPPEWWDYSWYMGGFLRDPGALPAFSGPEC